MAYAVVWLTVTVYVSPGVYVSTAAPNESTRLSAMLGLLVTPECAPLAPVGGGRVMCRGAAQ